MVQYLPKLQRVDVSSAVGSTPAGEKRRRRRGKNPFVIEGFSRLLNTMMFRFGLARERIECPSPASVAPIILLRRQPRNSVKAMTTERTSIPFAGWDSLMFPFETRLLLLPTTLPSFLYNYFFFANL